MNSKYKHLYISATCFYIGRGLFITNKHFFDINSRNPDIFIKNKNFELKSKVIFIPKNLMDIAIVEVIDIDQNVLKQLKPIVISQNKIDIMQTAFAVNFSFFSQSHIKKFESPIISKGTIIKKHIFKTIELTYQIDCSCYSGGSGGPIVNESQELIGVLFANLTFEDKENKLQIPKTGIIIGRDCIQIIIDFIEKYQRNIYKLDSLWIFNIPDEELDEYYNNKKFIPKF